MFSIFVAELAYSAYYTCMEFTRQLIKWIRMDYK